MNILAQNPFQVDNGHRFYTDASTNLICHSNHGLRLNIRDFILQPGYPCVGAQAAVHGETFATGDFGAMQGSGTAKNLAFGLFEYLIAMSGSPSDFLTYIAVFPESGFGDEPEFEAALWELLNRLHSEDRKHFEWCPEYAKDPATNDFSFCFGGQGFFIVGLHPHSSRKARRFRYPAIAFNLQSQFEALRKKGRFDTMRKAIREREIEFQGAINPMLADLGEGMQAPQYSGRKVDEDWTCPFSVQE